MPTLFFVSLCQVPSAPDPAQEKTRKLQPFRRKVSWTVKTICQLMTQRWKNVECISTCIYGLTESTEIFLIHSRNHLKWRPCPLCMRWPRQCRALFLGNKSMSGKFGGEFTGWQLTLCFFVFWTTWFRLVVIFTLLQLYIVVTVPQNMRRWVIDSGIQRCDICAVAGVCNWHRWEWHGEGPSARMLEFKCATSQRPSC